MKGTGGIGLSARLVVRLGRIEATGYSSESPFILSMPCLSRTKLIITAAIRNKVSVTIPWHISTWQSQSFKHVNPTCCVIPLLLHSSMPI